MKEKEVVVNGLRFEVEKLGVRLEAREREVGVYRERREREVGV